MDNIDFGHLFLQFDGRINRAKIWLGIVILWAVEAVVFLIVGYDSALSYILILLLLWPSLALSIKRWHDRDKSGWWVLIVLIPIIGPIWALVELGFLPGTSGPNQYGPDPLDTGASQAA